jgi:hypothetical protein
MKIEDLIVKTEKVKWQDLKDLQPSNLKLPYHNEKLKKSLIDLGFAQAIYVWEDPSNNDVLICDGHTRADVLRELINDGYDVPDELTCTFLDNTKIKTKKEAIKYLLRVFNTKKNPIDNVVLEDWIEIEDVRVEDIVVVDLDIKIDIDDLDDEVSKDDRKTSSDYDKKELGGLKKRFLWTPFSVFDTKQGDWQDKKRYWNRRGIDSGDGRGENLLASSSIMLDIAGTSIFDPVLCEILYNWYCPKDGLILDCFAGGSVRGIMANFQGMNYIGCELRKEQVDSNRSQYLSILDKENFQNTCTWIEDDSRNILKHCSDVKADLLFSCPPYADLEVYSDDPRDISNMDYKSFLEAYCDIINKSCSLLKDNSFAIFIVGEVRDKKGNYYNFVGDTIQAFKDTGLNYYNEAILLNAIGTMPLRVGGMFKSSRKLGKVHQNILIFSKGDPKIATQNIGVVDFSDVVKNDMNIDGVEEL